MTREPSVDFDWGALDPQEPDAVSRMGHALQDLLAWVMDGDTEEDVGRRCLLVMREVRPVMAAEWFWARYRTNRRRLGKREIRSHWSCKLSRLESDIRAARAMVEAVKRGGA